MQQQPQILALLLAAPEAARYLGVSERTFHSLRRQPAFPRAVVLGARSIRWNRDELTAFAQELPRITLMAEPFQLAARGK